MRTADADAPGMPGASGLSPSGGAVHRVLLAEVERASARRGGQPVRVLDAGGGSGVWAVAMAVAGCQVTVVDTNPNALAALRGRARDAGVADRVTAVQADVQALTDAVPAGGAELVLGHGLLEVVDEVAASVRQLAAATAPGGAVSVLVSGRFGAALGQVHAGRLAQARAMLTDPAGRSGQSDPLQRRLDLSTLRGLLESEGRLRIETVRGDGVFEGWLPPAVPDGEPGAPEGRSELEELAATVPELLALAARLHVLARRPDT